MDLILISDTHNRWNSDVPQGDILVHAGDLTHTGAFAELRQGVRWLKSLPHKHKILVAGNHDVCLENILVNGKEPELRDFLHPIVYLRDSGIVLGGLQFWGSPWIPIYGGGFNIAQDELRAKWSKIPDGLEVLVTHTPPKGILDKEDEESIGCSELGQAIKRVRPRVHAFGHAHQGHGHRQLRWDDKMTTDCYNSATTSYRISLSATLALSGN